MTLTPDEAKLVERLQCFVDACSGHDITLYEGHPAVLVGEAIAAITRIAEERAQRDVDIAFLLGDSAEMAEEAGATRDDAEAFVWSEILAKLKSRLATRALSEQPDKERT